MEGNWKTSSFFTTIPRRLVALVCGFVPSSSHPLDHQVLGLHRCDASTMPKVPSTSTSSKSSSKATKDKPAGEKKQKRPPSAYNLYIKNNSAKWKEENPGKKQSEMMKEMAVLWKDADENPNKGREPKPKKKKSDSARATVAKDAASSSPPPSSPGLASSDD
ncbi:hypothetical protein D9758_016722 [Tetrapyrgos nigripes]|uniref:HMG box domain-containing protein n=1 Tax=Tetrapyrgos nigripes TaxID=182062 RepID=A0A8H5F8Z7_9AGAR|nr:hypothetical protein D9758_016722 [Tetrapyrgos nigripes]